MSAYLPPAGVVRYADASLSDVLPSALAALGVQGEPNALGLDAAESVVVLLVDGLGFNLLRRHAEYAPFLAGLSGRALTAGFPTTTVASIASLGTGLPSGEHGLTAYTSRVDGVDEPVNWLRWETAQSGSDLLARLPPEELQPRPTAFERAASAGVAVSVVSSYAFRGSGLTRAVLRGGTYVPVFTAADTVTAVSAAVRGPGPSLVYCYNGDLDLIGHGLGCGSEAWRVQLALIDRAVELLAERLPSATRLLVTGDHGMIDVPEHAKIDYDEDPVLSADVELIAGEGRVRYLHVAAGYLEQVHDRWREKVGDRMAVLTRDDAVGRGWFGPTVSPTAYGRIGDLVVVSTSDTAVVRRKAEPLLSRLRGHHGALTDDELLVPLLLW
jgi:predicted AlkP superfamily pyrophosphatase or phosphodiesterase